MKALLNRGINFAIRPQKLNISEMLADHQRLVRGMMWMDYFSGQDSDSSQTKPNIFKQRKTNLPSSKKYKPPEDLKTFFRATHSELEDPENRNRNSIHFLHIAITPRNTGQVRIWVMSLNLVQSYAP